MRSLTLALLLAVSACGNTFGAMRAPAFRPNPVAEDAARPHVPGEITAIWIGHATVLVKLDDRWVITDPIFSARLGGVVKRYVAPGIDLAGMPRLSWVLISHAHTDHLDIPSLRRLDATAELAVPPGVLAYLPDSLPFAEVAPLARWRSVEKDGVRVTAVPAKHVNGRWFFDEMWSRQANTGWIVEHHGLTVYFAGDTAYDAGMFREIRRRFPHIDLALIPVGPAGESHMSRWFSKRWHVDPEQAMRAFEDLGARWMIPIHHGTFYQTGANEDRAITRAIMKHDLLDRVLFLRIGETVVLAPRLHAAAAATR